MNACKSGGLEGKTVLCERPRLAATGNTHVKWHFTVRRISYGEGVERVFPVNSPNIEKIEIESESEPMRARMYYLRSRTGKAAMAIKEKRTDLEGGAAAPVPAAPAAPAAAAPAS